MSYVSYECELVSIKQFCTPSRRRNTSSSPRPPFCGAWPEDGVRIFHYITYTSRARFKKKGRRISIGWICEDLGLQWRQLDTNPGSKTFPHRSAESSRKYSIGLANHHLSTHSHSRRPWWPPSPWGRPVVSRRIFKGTRNDPPLQLSVASPPPSS